MPNKKYENMAAVQERYSYLQMLRLVALTDPQGEEWPEGIDPIRWEAMLSFFGYRVHVRYDFHFGDGGRHFILTPHHDVRCTNRLLKARTLGPLCWYILDNYHKGNNNAEIV